MLTFLYASLASPHLYHWVLPQVKTKRLCSNFYQIFICSLQLTMNIIIKMSTRTQAHSRTHTNANSTRLETALLSRVQSKSPSNQPPNCRLNQRSANYTFESLLLLNKQQQSEIKALAGESTGRRSTKTKHSAVTGENQ